MPMSWLRPIARAWTTEDVHASPQPQGAPGPHLNSMPSRSLAHREGEAQRCRVQRAQLEPGDPQGPSAGVPSPALFNHPGPTPQGPLPGGSARLNSQGPGGHRVPGLETKSCLLPAGLLLGQGQPCWEGPRSWRPEEGGATLGWMSPPHDAPEDPCPPGTDGQARLSCLVQVSWPLQQKPKSPYCVQGHLGCAWPARTSLGLGSVCPCFSGARAAVRKSRDPCP